MRKTGFVHATPVKAFLELFLHTAMVSVIDNCLFPLEVDTAIIQMNSLDSLQNSTPRLSGIVVKVRNRRN